MATPLAKITDAAAKTVTDAAAEALMPNFRIGGKKVYLCVHKIPVQPEASKETDSDTQTDRTT